jgi:hypothetical protein
MAGAIDRRVWMHRTLAKTTNPVLASFRHSWDGSAEGARRFIDEIDGWAVDSATRDAAADFIEDLIDRMNRHLI